MYYSRRAYGIESCVSVRSRSIGMIILHAGWSVGFVIHSAYPMEQDDRLSIAVTQTHRYLLFLFRVNTIEQKQLTCYNLSGDLHAMMRTWYLICLDFIGLRLVCPETCQWPISPHTIPAWPMETNRKRHPAVRVLGLSLTA